MWTEAGQSGQTGAHAPDHATWASNIATEHAPLPREYFLKLYMKSETCCLDLEVFGFIESLTTFLHTYHSLLVW